MKRISIIILFLAAVTLIVISCGTETSPETFSLTTSMSPVEGGTVSPAQGSFEEGETVSLQATPTEGWVFSRWEQDLNTTANPMNITMNRDYTVVGVFEQRMYALTVDVEGQGTVTETVVQQKSTDYAEGTVIELEAVPGESWVFVHWEGDLSSSDNPAQITVNEPKSIVGVFERPWPTDTETEVVDVTNPATGKTWMDRNLGASRAATSMTDEQAYGDLYQWGRATDGHEIRTSGTTSTLSDTDTPGHGNYITYSSNPYDWRSSQNDSLWQGVNGTNNPCPSGYRLPTEAEWKSEHKSWSSNDAAGSFSSPLKLPLGGYRYGHNGSLIHSSIGLIGYYWTSTVVGTESRGFNLSNSQANFYRFARAGGRSVRCIKD